jgi:exodeoxyribonuclease-3
MSDQKTSTLSVVTWNVNGIRAREGQFLEWIDAVRPDVVCLQEIKAAPSQLPQGITDLPGYWSYWHGAEGGYSGVALLLNHRAFPEEPAFSHPAFDNETRIVQATVGDLILASVYIPNGGKDYQAKLEFLKEMGRYVADVHAGGSQMILSGDMNIVRTDRDIHPSQNKPGIIGTRPDERALFEEMIGNGLVDVGRMLDPDNDRLFTWWPFWRSARERNLGWRLDYIFASKPIADRATTSTVMRETGTSDHGPVVVEFGKS